MKRLLNPIFMILSINQILASSLRSEVRKCCAPGEVLEDLEGNLSCVEMLSLTEEINNLTPDSWGLPDCSLSQGFFFLSLDKIHKDDLQVSYSACLDNLHNNKTENNSPIIVYCDFDTGDLRDSKNSLRKPNVLSAKKCCPSGEYYNVDSKSCVFVKDEIHLKYFLRITDEVDLLTLGEGPPVCENVLVNYMIGLSDVYKENGKVMVKIPWGSGHIDLTNQNDVENICLDVDTSRNALLIRICMDESYCENKSCIRKCCPEDEAFFSGSKCEKYSSGIRENIFHTQLINASNLTNSSFNPNDYGLLIGKTCTYDMYALLPEEGWTITPQGYIYSDEEQRILMHDKYCMEMFLNNSDFEGGIYPLACFDPPVYETEEPVRALNGSLQIISSICLLMTLLVYICIPSLQNLHGKTLMCHVTCLFVAYICLAMVTFDITKSKEAKENEEPEKRILCSIIGYVMLFSFISTFSWLNVMCFDIWWTFRNTRSPDCISKSQRQRNRFIAYCLYSWGIASGVTSLCILMDFTDILSYNKRPRIGVDRCWFLHGLGVGEIVFFTGPITIQLLVNLVFFVLTSMNYNKVKSEIRRVMSDPMGQRNRRLQADREKLVMNVKLFVVMGISWICEVLSNYMNQFLPELLQYKIFIVFDIINCLQGAFIFVLFVLKKKVYDALRQRMAGINDRGSSSSALSTRDPYRVKKSSSNSTLMSTFVVSSPAAVIPEK